MKAWWLAFCVSLHKERFSLWALVLTIGTWLLVTNIVPIKYVDIFAYIIVGWYWLGGVVVPWVERKLERLFG